MGREEESGFSQKQRKKGSAFFFLLLQHVLYGLLPVSVMSVFVLMLLALYFCNSWLYCSLSPSAEGELNLDVTQGEGEAVSHKGLVSGRPIVNKRVCFFGRG